MKGFISRKLFFDDNLEHGQEGNNIEHGQEGNNIEHGQAGNNIEHGQEGNNLEHCQEDNNLEHGQEDNNLEYRQEETQSHFSESARSHSSFSARSYSRFSARYHSITQTWLHSTGQPSSYSADLVQPHTEVKSVPVRSKFASYHVYQRSWDKSVVFSSGKDALVFISIVKVKAIELGVKVYALCLMDNHIHMLVRVRDKSSLHRFVTDYTSWFAKVYNKRHQRIGMLFSSPFGRSYKRTDKYVRNCISYINNNPVEAGKTSNIEEYVWNLFSFGKSSHPHSEALDLSRSRKCIRFCCRVLRAEFGRGRYLSYELLDEVFSKTDKREAVQLVDYILNLYNPLDFSAINSLYGNLDKASLAINSNTGSEYDIAEDDSI